MPSKKITVKTSEVLKERNEFQQKGLDLPHVSLTKEGVVPKSERYERDFLVKDEEKDYKVTRIGDLCYNPANLKFGVITLNEKYNGIFSPIYVTFEINKRLMTNLYAKYFFLRHSFVGRLMRYQQGTVYERMSVSPEDFVRDSINIHDLSDQERIGAFLSAIDRLIEKQKEKFDRIKTLKNSYLQKMFPVDGQHEPRIRFSNSLGKWKELTFGEIAEYKKGPFGSALVKALFLPKGSDTVKVYEQQNAIEKDDKLERYFISKDYAMKMKSFEVHSGDIIVSCAGTIGESFILPETAEIGIINQALMRVRVKETIVLKAFFQYVFSEMVVHFSQVHSNGSAIKNIPPFSDLKPKKVLIPQLEEQYKIVALLGRIDRLIEKEEATVNRYESLKKAYLQKIFAD